MVISRMSFIVAGVSALVMSVTADIAKAQMTAGECVDRCYAATKACLAPVPPTGPNQPIPANPIGSSPNVPTPPPYDFCIMVQQQCVQLCKTNMAPLPK